MTFPLLSFRRESTSARAEHTNSPSPPIQRHKTPNPQFRPGRYYYPNPNRSPPPSQIVPPTLRLWIFSLLFLLQPRLCLTLTLRIPSPPILRISAGHTEAQSPEVVAVCEEELPEAVAGADGP